MLPQVLPVPHAAVVMPFASPIPSALPEFVVNVPPVMLFVPVVRVLPERTVKVAPLLIAILELKLTVFVVLPVPTSILSALDPVEMLLDENVWVPDDLLKTIFPVPLPFAFLRALLAAELERFPAMFKATVGIEAELAAKLTTPPV